MRCVLLLTLGITACGSNSALTELGTNGGRVGAQVGAGTGGIAGTSNTIPTKKLVAKMIAAADHVCAVLSGGTVQCWGYNGHDELGNSTVASDYGSYSSVPVTVADITNAVSVTAGGFHTCAVLSDGSIQCAGWNIYGELGNGTIADYLVPSTVTVSVAGITDAVVVAAGSTHTCAVLLSGTVQCWGDDSYGQLGIGTTTSSSVPVTVTGITNAVAVAAGGLDTCALLSDGTVQCWGVNWDGELGIGTRTGNGMIPVNSVPVPVAVIGVTNAVAVATDGEDSCALLSDGTVQCWGGNDRGELGNGTSTNIPLPTCGEKCNPDAVNVSTVPVTVTGIGNATAITSIGCALLSDGTVQCWGGPGSVPVTVSGIDNAVAVAGTVISDCALLSDGAVQCWGDNTDGELGNGTTTSTSVPVTVTGF